MKTKMITLPVHPVHMLWILLTLFIKADGETVSITLKCGGIKTNVTSPNYPDNYNNNLEIHWDVRADLAQRILVAFNDFKTENQDALDIVEEKYPSPGAKYRGSNAATPYLSLGNHLRITFTSDNSESRRGFDLSISCFNETDDTGIHEAFGDLEHTRVMTQPVCKDAWDTDVADTVCREAGFPGSYKTNFTSETENISESEEINYQCTKTTFRLQDCKTLTSRCIAQDSLVIVCSVLSELGCFDVAEYTHLLSSVKLSRDQCLVHCKALSTTPQYAVHHSGTNCSCINQTALDVTELTQERSRCRTTSESQTGHYATLFNVSLGFCSEPPELHKGSWINTLNGFMYGTTITAKCNDNYELVDGHSNIRCDKATTSTTQDFEWHGTTPSCLKKNTGSSKILKICLGVFIPAAIIIIIGWLIWKLWQKKKKGESLCLPSICDFQQPDCRNFHCLSGVCAGTRPTSPVSQREDPEEQVPSSPEDTSRSHSPIRIYPKSSNAVTYLPKHLEYSDLSKV